MGYCIFALSSDLINISGTAPSAIYLHQYSPEFKWNWLKILFIPRGWILVILISLDLSFCATVRTKMKYWYGPQKSFIIRMMFVLSPRYVLYHIVWFPLLKRSVSMWQLWALCRSMWEAWKHSLAILLVFSDCVCVCVFVRVCVQVGVSWQPCTVWCSLTS